MEPCVYCFIYELVKKVIFATLGVLSLGLAIWGIILPRLPTTPIVLVAAYFFAKSSPKLHNRLINHKYFGPLIKDWKQHKSIPLKIKILALSMMSVMCYFAIFHLIEFFPAKIMVGLLALTAYVVVGFVIPTRKSS